MTRTRREIQFDLGGANKGFFTSLILGGYQLFALYIYGRHYKGEFIFQRYDL